MGKVRPVAVQSKATATVHVVQTSTLLSLPQSTEDATATKLSCVPLRAETLYRTAACITGHLLTGCGSTVGEEYEQQEACLKKLHLLVYVRLELGAVSFKMRIQ